MEQAEYGEVEHAGLSAHVGDSNGRDGMASFDVST
jgi:hypothetical protein